jgi:hypothetical protein
MAGFYVAGVLEDTASLLFGLGHCKAAAMADLLAAAMLLLTIRLPATIFCYAIFCRWWSILYIEQSCITFHKLVK